jgi:hypothetical protein
MPATEGELVMKNRCIWLLAAVAALGVPLWAAPATRFKDVPAHHWAATAIAAATQKGVMRPATQNAFRPDQPVTRAELAVILVRAIEYLESRGPVKISTSPAKPEVPPAQVAALQKFGRSHPSYAVLHRLVQGGYLIPDPQGKAFLPTPENIRKPATAAEVATAVAGIMVRITEKRAALEAPETLQEGDRPETRGS